MDSLLFYTHDLRQVIEGQGRALVDEIDTLTESEVLNTSQEDMIEYLSEKYRVNPLRIDETGIRTDFGDAQIDVSRDFLRAINDRSKPFYITGTRVTFYVPFIGDSELLHCKPYAFATNLPRAAVVDNEIVFTYDVTTEQASGVGERFEQDLRNTLSHARRVDTDVEKFNADLLENIKRRLSARREKLLQDRSLVEKLGFPLRRRQSPPSTFVTPAVKKRITPQKPTSSSEPFSPEPALGVDDYEHILSILSNMAAVMEHSPRAFKDMGEEDLRTHFLVQLNGQYEGQATGETFNYEGKTDILVKEDGKNIFVAECKFWTGPAGLTKALDQLLGYTAWRDTKTAILVFNRDRNTSIVLEGVSKTVQEHPNYKAERETELETEFRYIFGHRDDTNREITVTILVFDVPG